MSKGHLIMLIFILAFWCGIAWVIYEFIINLPVGALDCTITIGREGC